MTDSEVIALEGVSLEQVTLLNDSVLVRVLDVAQVRASKLILPDRTREQQVGQPFYAEVVRVGPGALVREGPSPESVADVVRNMLRPEGAHRPLTIVDGRVAASEWDPERPVLYAKDVEAFATDVLKFMEARRVFRRVPVPWKVGDHVLVRTGHGPELDLREGRFHIIERAGVYGHGIVAAWDPAHRHCWHAWACEDESGKQLIGARCRCGAIEEIKTRLPACVECPDGERLAEAVLGGKHVYDVPIPDAPKVHEFDPDRPGGFSAGELRPE